MLWMLLALGLAPTTEIVAGRLPSIRLESDTAAVVAETPKGFVLAPDASGKLLQGEKDMLAQTLAQAENAMGPNSLNLQTNRETQPLVAGKLRFNLIEHQGSMILTIQNGLPQSYMYKARIGRGSESTITDVCQLVPQTRSFEHWPYKFDWIEITELRPVGYLPGAPPRCE